MIRSKFLLILLALFAGLSISASAHAQSSATWYERGQKAEAKDDYQAAYEAYQKAYQKNPGDLKYKATYLRLKVAASSAAVTAGEKLRRQGDDSGALTEFMRALEIDPSNELAQQDIDAIRRHQSPQATNSETPNPPESDLSDAAAPAQLKPLTREPLTLHMVEDVKNIYQAIGKAAGINILFDPEYVSKRIQVDVTNESLTDTLRILGTVSGTFYRAITPNTIFVAQNTRAKRTELEEQAVQTFYLTNASQQNDLNDIQTALRNVLANAKLYGVPSQNAIVMRATPDELLLAQKLINDLDKARSEVVVDVAIMEVSRDKLRNIGLTLPQSFGASLQTSNASSSSSSTSTSTSTTTSTTNLTLNNLANLNATNFAVTVSSATANLLLTDTGNKMLQNPRIRASDGQKATMKVGERIPVATGSYSSGTSTSVVSSLVNTQFQYLDVGVNIEMTPTVHFDRDVTLKMKIEVSAQNGSVTISSVTEPIISQRTVEQTIRLREGEASILGGILEKQDTMTISGMPGLGEIPILKYLFSSQQHEVVDDEIVFVLIPHIVRATQIDAMNLRTLDSGTGQTVEIRHIEKPEVDEDATDNTAQPAPQPVAAPMPTVRDMNQAHQPAASPVTAAPAPAKPAPQPATPTVAAPQASQTPATQAVQQPVSAVPSATATATPAASAPVAAPATAVKPAVATPAAVAQPATLTPATSTTTATVAATAVTPASTSAAPVVAARPAVSASVAKPAVAPPTPSAQTKPAAVTPPTPSAQTATVPTAAAVTSAVTAAPAPASTPASSAATAKTAATTTPATPPAPAVPVKVPTQEEIAAAQFPSNKLPPAPPGIVVKMPTVGPPAPPAPISFTLVPAQSTQTLNSTFQIALNLAGGRDVYSVPFQVQYDKDKLALVNVDSGNLLGKDGQAISVVHRDDGNGGLTVVVARPPGTSGVDGSGTVCVLTFQAKAAGDALLKITRITAMNSGQQQIPSTGSEALVHIK